MSNEETPYFMTLLVLMPLAIWFCSLLGEPEILVKERELKAFCYKTRQNSFEFEKCVFEGRL